MPNLKVIVQYDDVKLNSTAKIQSAVLNVDNIISATSNPSSLISDDDNNDLKLGSDNKLLSQPTDTDFLAYYILSKISSTYLYRDWETDRKSVV